VLSFPHSENFHANPGDKISHLNTRFAASKTCRLMRPAYMCHANLSEVAPFKMYSDFSQEIPILFYKGSLIQRLQSHAHDFVQHIPGA
jgi:hypothetical protein